MTKPIQPKSRAYPQNFEGNSIYVGNAPDGGRWQDIDTSKLDARGTPVFLLRGLLIRYHPNDATGPVEVDGVPMTTLAGLIGLQGFDQTNAGLLDCHFVADESVTPGQVVFEPRKASER